ncbi:caspase activity and apoptosis inhibitor 1 [Chamberlinius hualienensis]
MVLNSTNDGERRSGANKKAGNVSGKKSKRDVRTIKPDEDAVTASLMDLSLPVHPLGHYVSDRVQLVEQVFKSVWKDNQWQTLVPDILRDLSLDELKKLCVLQLEVMSKKRIKKILAGEEMESSSGTDDSDEGEEANLIAEKGGDRLVAGTSCRAADSTSKMDEEITESETRKSATADENVEDMLELHAENSDDDDLLCDKNLMKLARDELTGGQVSSVSQPTAEDSKVQIDNKEEPLKLSGFNIQSMELSQPSVQVAKTCMEILELELRARAIKSLLNSQSGIEDQKAASKNNNT